MKLIRCYIENFGKISKKEIKFNDQLHIIEEENGWGKTTLASFIKAMLYGFEKASRKKELSEREKYKPWNNGKFGGNLELEVQNKRYKIERFFGDTPKGDKFVLTDLSTNKESQDFSEKIGEEIFKLDKQSFERSIYIPQQTIEVEISNSLTTKLTNLDNLQDDMNKYEEATNKLTKKSDELKKNKKAIEVNLKELEKSLENCEKTKQIYEEYKKQNSNKMEEIKKIKSEIGEIENKIKIINEQKLKQEILNQYNALLQQEAEIKEKKQQIDNFFICGVPTTEEINSIEVLIQNLQIENNKLIEIEQEIKNLYKYSTLTDSKLENNMSLYKEYKTIKEETESAKKTIEIKEERLKEVSNKKVNFIYEIILMIAGILITIFIENKIPGIAVIVFAVLSLIVRYIISKKIKEKKQLEREIEEEKSELNYKIETLQETQNKLQNFISEYVPEFNEELIYENLYEIQNKFLEFKNKIKIRLEIEKGYQYKKQDIENFLHNFFKEHLDYRKNIEFIKLGVKNKQDIDEKYESIFKAKQSFMQKYDVQNLSQKQEVQETIEELQEKLNVAKSSQEVLMQNTIMLQRQMESFLNVIEQKSDIVEEMDSLNSSLDNLIQKKRIIDLTLEMFEKTKEKLSNSYLGSINENLNKYLVLLTDNEELNNINIDIDLNTKVEVDGEKKQMEFFSAGNKDLIGICTRLSIIDSIFKDEKPFLIFDDPFVNLDKEKIEKALDLINKVSKEFQIIYFTCHESRK